MDPDPDFKNIFTVKNKWDKNATTSIAYLKTDLGYKFYQYHSIDLSNIKVENNEDLPEKELDEIRRKSADA
jgi:hypothetical protein